MKKSRFGSQTFTQHFGLRIEQKDLEFLDVYADKDMPVFLDPFGISVMGTTWAKQCDTEIASYFQYLIDSINTGNKRAVGELLGALHEVNEIALGYSSGEPRGRGVGIVQAKEIRAAFENSEAGKSGDIKDIADCAIMIPGINHDKISDITANILKNRLIHFTQEQCKNLSILMRRVAVNAFDHDKFVFRSYYADLPVINGKPKILLPISGVRTVPQLSKDKYYRNFVLEFLKAEHEHAGDSLSYVLRNGDVVVRIKDLKVKYPLNTNLLYNFSKEHPEILEKYKEELRQSARENNSIDVLETNRKILTPSERKRILSDIKPGNDDATDFHKISFDNFIYIFGHRLSKPFREKEINEGRKRIDLVFNNTDKSGFFYDLNTLHHIQCPKILAECKNYGKEIGNPEIDQLLGRFSKQRGRFGLLLCRTIQNKELMIKRCKDVLHDHKGYIIVLTDNDIDILLDLKDRGSENLIDDYMGEKLDQLIM